MASDHRAGLKPTVRVTVLELHIQESKMQQKVTAQIGATPISIETGKIARLADGAVVVTCGDTMVACQCRLGHNNQRRPGLFPAHR